MPGSDSQQRQSGRRLDFGFMEGDTQTSVPSTGTPTLYFCRFGLFSARCLNLWPHSISRVGAQGQGCARQRLLGQLSG